MRKIIYSLILVLFVLTSANPVFLISCCSKCDIEIDTIRLTTDNIDFIPFKPGDTLEFYDDSNKTLKFRVYDHSESSYYTYTAGHCCTENEKVYFYRKYPINSVYPDTNYLKINLVLSASSIYLYQFKEPYADKYGFDNYTGEFEYYDLDWKKYIMPDYDSIFIYGKSYYDIYYSNVGFFSQKYGMLTIIDTSNIRWILRINK